MAISGLIGAGAAESLQELLARQLLQQRLAEEQRQADLRTQLEREGLQQRQTEHADSVRLREQALREQANRAGVEDMLQQHALMNQRDPLQEYEARKMIDLKYRPPERDPLAEYEAKKKIDLKYRDAQTGPQGSPQWVIGPDGQRVYRIPRPGDQPYDAVAERNKPSGEPSAYATERATRTLQSVDELMGKVSRRTAGFGSLLARLPETDARNFAVELETLKANIAFNELTAMREASKTGGALGQVSNRELGMLESALGALDPAQSPENLRAQLQKIKESVQRWQKAVQGASRGASSLEPMTPVSSHGESTTPSPSRFRFNPQTGKVEPVP